MSADSATTLPRVPKIFSPSEEEIDRHIKAHPLAVLVSSGPRGLMATPLPLILQKKGGGDDRLIGIAAVRGVR